jgi:hypothetical protein
LATKKVLKYYFETDKEYGKIIKNHGHILVSMVQRKRLSTVESIIELCSNSSKMIQLIWNFITDDQCSLDALTNVLERQDSLLNERIDGMKRLSNLGKSITNKLPFYL